MAEWQDTIERFEAGDVGPDALQALLSDGSLSPVAEGQVRNALLLAEGLRGMWRGRGPTAAHIGSLRDRLEGIAIPELPEAPTAAECLGEAEDDARRLLAETVEACGASEGTLWLLSADGTKLVGTINSMLGGGRNTALERLTVPVAASAVGQAFQQNQPILIGREDYQDPVATWTSGVDVTAMIAVPFSSDGTLRGVVSVVNPAGREAFEPADTETLAWKARLLGLVTQRCFREESAKWLNPRG